MSARDLCRQDCISNATFYNWRSDDTQLRKRLAELSSERRRFGYRRLHLLLKREGWVLNWNKIYRLYKEEKLTVRKRGGRKRALRPGNESPNKDPARVQPALNSGLRIRHFGRLQSPMFTLAW